MNRGFIEIAEAEPNNPELSAEDVSTIPGPETQPKPFRASKSLDQIDPANIPEFRPMNSLPLSGDQHQDMQSGQQSPYYPGYYTEQGYYPAPSRPNLYLYSPSNNTLIPCEEIIIPNPAVSGEGPVYPGPTNIYLAYPVSGPDGRGYITQPFSPPLPQEYMSYPSYSPSISDGSHYHSSTPQTPNSGHDSGSSTQPASPPPLVNYHPSSVTLPLLILQPCNTSLVFLLRFKLQHPRNLKRRRRRRSPSPTTGTLCPVSLS